MKIWCHKIELENLDEEKIPYKFIKEENGYCFIEMEKRLIENIN
jgi:hypothetical protein